MYLLKCSNRIVNYIKQTNYMSVMHSLESEKELRKIIRKDENK